MNIRAKCVMIILIFSLCILSGCSYRMSAEEETNVYNNATVFYAKVVEKCTDFNEISLKELTEFDWDTLYIFGAYYYANQIKEKTGIDWNGFRSSEIEDTANIVFLKGGRIVCYYYEQEIGKGKIIFDDVYEKEIYAVDNPKIKVKEFRGNNIVIELVGKSDKRPR